jgi:hypothetical protein
MVGNLVSTLAEFQCKHPQHVVERPGIVPAEISLVAHLLITNIGEEAYVLRGVEILVVGAGWFLARQLAVALRVFRLLASPKADCDSGGGR